MNDLTKFFTKPEVEMHSFKDFISEESKSSAIEEGALLSDFFDGFEYEINTKLSSGARIVYRIRSGDRDNDRDEILRRLRHAGVDAKLGSSDSSVDPIDGIFDNKKFRIEVKPLAGGMGETTLNSSITELFPCIAFEKGYYPKNVEDFHKYLMSIDVSTLKCVNSSDIEAAKETINKADTSTKFDEKMKNAIGVLEYLRSQHNDKPIKNVYWGYRAKPSGISSKHPGDMFIEYTDGKFLGISLKAGGKKTSEPQLNTYVKPVFIAFGEKRMMETLRSLVYSQIYSKIEGMPSLQTFDGGPNGRHPDRKKTSEALKAYDKENNKKYEADYDAMLEIMRKGVIDLFNKDKNKTLKYIKNEILREAPDVPTVVIKAIGKDFKEVVDRNELGVFLPQVQYIRAYTSSTSKQEWFIELKSGNDILKMKMTIRTNKPGHAGVKKLGQFPTKLSIKYNGISK